MRESTETERTHFPRDTYEEWLISQIAIYSKAERSGKHEVTPNENETEKRVSKRPKRGR